jgi:hypothetical protein
MLGIRAMKPGGVWTQYHSKHLRGKPAIHAVLAGNNRTLCGHTIQGWSFIGLDVSDINCRRCLNSGRMAMHRK